MSYKDIEKCNCGRSYCQYVDHVGDSTSYTTEEVKELIIELEEGLEHLKGLFK
jgi:hypothetical protein